ncbi:nucleoside diphosphate kinase 6 [Grus japonensis]|uniref:Nucleoside diphosphate kinase 6 n=1 Tax=Grus japonensis TaxID=30415 RepID=A0ABC9WRS8_GRUJA
MLDLVLTNKVVGNVKLKGSLGCSDHEMVEFKILRAARRTHSKCRSREWIESSPEKDSRVLVDEKLNMT